MTSADNPANIVFDSGGSNEITILTENVEESRTKEVKVSPLPTTKSNRTVNTCTFDNTTDTITTPSAHGLANGDQVVFYTATGTLPAEVSLGKYYYVINSATTTFKFSLTEGGSAVDFTDNGSGTLNVRKAVKKALVLDLLRAERRWTINGYIETTNRDKLYNLFELGGSFSMTWDGDIYFVFCEKLTYTKDKTENNERPVLITVVEGTDL